MKGDETVQCMTVNYRVRYLELQAESKTPNHIFSIRNKITNPEQWISMLQILTY